MRSINIVLHFKNARYAESLARGLCYETTGLNIFFEKDIDDLEEVLKQGLLLTDIGDDMNDKTIFFSNDIKNAHKYQLTKTSSLKTILKLINKIAFDKFDICLFTHEKKTKIVEVFSKKGGLGVTSFSITLARLISMKTESKTLYLNLGLLDDYTEYLDLEYFDSLSKRQYIVMHDNNIGVNLEDYLQNDIWNVYYFKPETGINSLFGDSKAYKIIDDLLESGFFSYIIIDSGKRHVEGQSYFKKQIEISRDKVIYTDLETSHCLNFDMPRDEDSFSVSGRHIDISMKGKYAWSIEEFVDKSGILY